MRAILLLFSLELKILGWPYREYIKTAKMDIFTVSIKNLLLKMTLRWFQPLSVVTTMVSTLLRQLGGSLQIKTIIINASFVLQFAAEPKHIINNSKKRLVTGIRLAYWKKMKLQKFQRKKSNKWAVMSFIHSASEIRIYKVSTGIKLNGVQLSLHFKNRKHKIQNNIFGNIFFEA